MKNNKLIIAAAGSGKTTFLIKEALKEKKGKILITTYTQANEEEIRKMIIEINKCISANITVQTWFSFLLQHGVRPYQGHLYEKKVKGLILVNNQSAPYTREEDTEKHYFTKQQNIYSDKLSKFVIRCNEKSKGAVIDRLSRIYSNIFIDEVQDLAGYDLEFLRLLFECNTRTVLVGDPRQGTYSTNNSTKNKKYKKSGIVHFFEDNFNSIDKDDTSLTINYRCVTAICDLSNKLFPNFKSTTSGNNTKTEHEGVFLVGKKDVNNYLQKYKPIQLRDSRKQIVNEDYKVMNFGESKGLSFDRVLIYPTESIIKWLNNNMYELAPTSRSKFYVALTRAKYSVGIVYEYKDESYIDGVKKFNINEK